MQSLVLALVLVARRLLVRLPTSAWILLLKAARLGVPAPEITEMIEILEGGPPGTTMVRRMVAESTDEEVRDLVWGALFFDPGRWP